MVYILSQKYFRKNADRMVRRNKFWIIDADNYGSTDDMDDSLSEKFNQVIPIGSLCPETELYRMLKRIKDGDKVNEKKYKRLLEEYTHNEDFAAGVCQVAKAQASLGVDEDINIFVVFPNVVYKILKDIILKRFNKIVKTEDVEWVRTQKDIEDGGAKKVLQSNLNRKDMKQVLKAVKKAEKKYKLIEK